jgi:hypothetical protein
MLSLDQLVGKDLNDIWEISNPMGVLTNILANQNKGLPESRSGNFLNMV